MQEWKYNGCRLGWLIDPGQEQVYIYRVDRAQQIIEGFDQKLSGEHVLPVFELDLSALWLN